MMSLLLRDLSHPVYKIERLLEIGEGKCPRDVMLVDHLPLRNLCWMRRSSSPFSGGTPPRQGTQVWLARSSGMADSSSIAAAACPPG